MNINKEIITLLKTATKLDVEQDEYEGTADKYITFTYEDERPELFGDNEVLADTVYLQIQLYTPKKFNYLSLKHAIRNALEGADYIVTSIQSFLGDSISGTEKIRQTIFTATKTESRGD